MNELYKLSKYLKTALAEFNSNTDIEFNPEIENELLKKILSEIKAIRDDWKIDIEAYKPEKRLVIHAQGCVDGLEQAIDVINKYLL